MQLVPNFSVIWSQIANCMGLWLCLGAKYMGVADFTVVSSQIVWMCLIAKYMDVLQNTWPMNVSYYTICGCICRCIWSQIVWFQVHLFGYCFMLTSSSKTFVKVGVDSYKTQYFLCQVLLQLFCSSKYELLFVNVWLAIGIKWEIY